MATKKAKSRSDLKLQYDRIKNELEYRNSQLEYTARYGRTQPLISDPSSGEKNRRERREAQRQYSQNNRRLQSVKNAFDRYSANMDSVNERQYKKEGAGNTRFASISGRKEDYMFFNKVPREQYMGIASKSNVGG